MANMTPEDFEAFLSQLGQSPSGGDGLAPTAPGSATGLGSLPASSLPPMPSPAAPVSNNQISLPTGGDGLAPTAPGSATGLGALGPTNAPDSGNVVSQFISKKYGVSPISDNQALLAAQQLGQANRNAANIGAAFATFAHGLSGSRAPMDNTNFHNMASQADDETKNVIQRRQGEVQDQALKKEQEADDPNSPMAQQVRSIYAPTMKRFGMDPAVLANMSADQIKNFAQQPLEQQARLAMIEATKAQTLAAAGEKASEKKGQRDIKLQETAQHGLNQDKEYTEAITKQNTVNDAFKYAQDAKTNGLSRQMLAPLIIPALTGLKRVNQAELNAASGSQDASSSAQRWVQKLVDGTMTDADYNNMVKTLSVAKRGADAAYADATGRHVTQYSRLTGKKPEDAAFDLGVQLPKPGAAAAQNKPTSVIQNGHTYNLNPETGQYE